MSIRPTTNGSRSAGQRQQPELELESESESNPAQSQFQSQPQSSYYIIGEQRYSWERALGSQRGARVGAPQMYSHDPRIALFGASSTSNNQQPNNLNNPLQSQSHNHSQFQSHSNYYPARIVAGSNNLNLRSRNARHTLGQQQPHTTRNAHHQNVPLNLRCSPRATAGNTKPPPPPHSEHSMRGTTSGSATGSIQLREIGRKYPLWLPEYKRRAFNVSPLERYS